MLLISISVPHLAAQVSVINDPEFIDISDESEFIVFDDDNYGEYVEIDSPDSVPAGKKLDFVAQNKSKFDYKQLILPGGLVAVGAFGVSNGFFRKIDNSVRKGMEKLRGDHYFRADDYIQYLPTAAYLGLGAVGVKCKHSFKERFAAGATAYLAMGIMVNAIKYTVREKRPDSDARNSFPSGHTATVFMGAELLRQEYGLGIAIGGYAVAGAVAFLRLYNDRHWLNDVIAGAGIGILSARIGYWMLPLYQKWFKWDKTQAAVLPTYDPGTRSAGVAFTANF